ncbi:AAC(3) family N-acetyltransferase [Bacillus sp. FSL K6-3431]|uniref:AAC(3) family N-acetyltransferase n=1 Tax=Bacillus sp. FSL K6-3431 TaxID=2921500 RepID=UPI0030FB2841
MLTKEKLKQAFKGMGIKEGMVLAVHTSLGSVGYIEGGPIIVIESLLKILGDDGTLVMPSMTSGEEVFDPKKTPTDEMGIVAETFWKMPLVKRSSHPNSSFAAKGKYAEEIISEQPLDDPEGIKSPIGKVFQLNGSILLLGVSHSANTMIHLAESLSNVPYRIASDMPVLRDGKVEKVSVPLINHCCQNFNKIEPLLKSSNLLSIHQIGNGMAQLMKAKDVVETACEQLNKNRYYFLCESDCDECMQARAYVAN